MLLELKDSPTPGLVSAIKGCNLARICDYFRRYGKIASRIAYERNTLEIMATLQNMKPEKS